MTTGSDPTPLVPSEAPTVVSLPALETAMHAPAANRPETPPEIPPETSSGEPSCEPVPGWPAWQRFLFRYAALHWLLYAFLGLCAGFLQTLSHGFLAISKTWSGLGIDMQAAPWNWPKLGEQALLMVDDPAQWLDRKSRVVRGGHGWWQEATSWLSQQGWTPWPVIQQPTGSGDTAHHWVQLALIVMLSLLLAGIWTGLSRTTQYPRLGRWLHLAVRFGLGFTLLNYGLEKLGSGQFGELELMRLTQDIGDTSPMSLVGTFQQANRGYELLGGIGEVFGGLLLFHRRTALFGTLVAIAVMANVCALNWLCGVPVKLYSSHLLLFSVGLLAPFADRLWALLVSNGPSLPVDLSVVRNRWLAGMLTFVSACWVVSYCYFAVVDGARQSAADMRDQGKSPLYGCWMVEQMRHDGVDVAAADATRWRFLAIDRGTLAWAEEAGGRRVYLDFVLDAAGTNVSVKRRGAVAGEPAVWTCELGSKVVPVDVPLLERREDAGRKVDGERRTLVLRGLLDGKPFELHTIEKRFRLQTGFRLRQELPEGW